MSAKEQKADAGKGIPFPVINIIECKACGRCVAACPTKTLTLSEDFNGRGYRYVQYSGEGCTGCGSCYYTCPEPGAVEVHISGKKT